MRDYSPEKFDLEPFGINETRRLTVQTAEEVLFKPRIIQHQFQRKYGEGVVDKNVHGFVRLVDYMGGDQAIMHAATGGLGMHIIKEAIPEMPLSDFFDGLYHNGDDYAFKFAQLKLHIEAPISVALFWVYYERFKINEYSGRYSVMINEQREISKGELEELIAEHLEKFQTKNQRETERDRVYQIFKGTQMQARGSYEAMIGGEFARELARTGLGLGNLTAWYCSANLVEFMDAVDIVRRKAKHNPDLTAFADKIEYLCSQVAPEAVASLKRQKQGKAKHIVLTVDRERLEAYDCREIPWHTPQPRYGASKTKRVTVSDAEEVLFVYQPYLDKGWFMPTDYMGTDDSVAQAARVSYGAGTKKVQEDHGLVRYLRRHRHTTPSEQVSYQVETKTPEFVSPRQEGRHRTFDKDGVLGQWIPLRDYYRIPDDQIAAQSAANRQGRGEQLSGPVHPMIRENLDSTSATQEWAIDELRKVGLEECKIDLIKGVGFYTRGTFKGDLHNLMHFLGLREDPHAQLEIRMHARLWGDFVRRVSPVSYQAYLDYQKNSISFTAVEIPIVVRMIKEGRTSIPIEWYEEAGLITRRREKKREASELDAKIEKLEFGGAVIQSR